ncbi:peptidase [Bifidobacterium leontopitheci]|nr:peptidase [Bifidobacterium leontopitheci]
MVLKRMKAAVGALLALVVTLAMMVAARPASAATLPRPDPGTYLPYQFGGTQIIGAMAKDDTNYYYCIEAGVQIDYRLGAATKVTDNDKARRLGWLMDHYRGGSAEDHAAIAVLAHDHFDLKPAAWAERRAVIMAAYPALAAKANQLWAEAGEHAPAGATIERTYAEGIREGKVTVSVTNAAGKRIAGIAYTAILDGPATFSNGQSQVSGVSGTSPITYAWKATGAGDVKARVRYDRKQVDHVESGQDLVRFGGSSQVDGTAVNFTVQRHFRPTLSTVTSQKIVDAGEPVSDTVTAGVASGHHWPDGLELAAEGWYFDRLDADDVEDGPIMPKGDESAQEFLERLRKAGYKPAAYGTTTFTAPGQSRDVQAVTKPGGDEPYRAPAAGGFGTWVWAFELDGQSAKAKQYLEDDVVSGFLEYTETNSNRSRLTVESTVTEHTGVVGSEISDIITVAGFPDDHGDFRGDDELGIGADRDTATVSVWWAGDPDDQANDEQYRPQGAEPPAEDEHHRLVGTWEYAAVNGRIRVGAGAPDVNGDPVHIVAENHGWYVFVWNFEGDDRVMPATSPYDDAWERVRIWEVAKPRVPTLTTQVKPDHVLVGEPFHDTARILGDVPEGAYVTFTAYEAVGPDDVPGVNGTLLHEVRVDVDHTLFEQTVSSPETRSPEPGLVYWQASLVSADGDVIASHALGVEGETVTVEEPPEPEEPEEEEPEEPEEPEMPKAGAAVTVAMALAAGTAAAGALLLLHRRRR